jgi:hypothetical protein
MVVPPSLESGVLPRAEAASLAPLLFPCILSPLKPARHTRPRDRVPSSSQVPDPYPILSNCSQQNTRPSLYLSYMLWLRPVSNIQHMHSACQGS